MAVLCGSSHTIFSKADKTVWATGCNATGQLGLGHTNQQNTPALVTAMAGYTDVVSLSHGALHQCTHYLRRSPEEEELE
jgi:alpha-tubulin suppressor-like RCC1 family protein